MDEQDLKQKKLEELQQQYLKQKGEEEKRIETENRMQSLISRFLEDDARQRLANVRLVNRELHMNAFKAIISLVQKGHVQEKLSDAQMKEILRQLGGRRETKIDFQRK